jgi:hypothetical protein
MPRAWTTSATAASTGPRRTPRASLGGREVQDIIYALISPELRRILRHECEWNAERTNDGWQKRSAARSLNWL